MAGLVFQVHHWKPCLQKMAGSGSVSSITRHPHQHPLHRLQDVLTALGFHIGTPVSVVSPFTLFPLFLLLPSPLALSLPAKIYSISFFLFIQTTQSSMLLIADLSPQCLLGFLRDICLFYSLPLGVLLACMHVCVPCA